MIRFRSPVVIPTVKSEAAFAEALEKKTKVIFDLAADITNLKNHAELVHKAGKRLFIHADLAEGIGKDALGLAYVRKQGVDGIISTRMGLVRLAKAAGLLTVHRFFMVDFQSVGTAEEALKATKADMVEVMPGLLPKVITKLAQQTEIPVIAGGLLETEQEVQAAFDAGAAAVSTEKVSLW